MQKPNKFIQKVRRQDRIATRVISLGGLLVIASVIAILLLIVRVTIPLFQGAKSNIVFQFPVSAEAESILALGVDDYREVAYTLDSKGVFSFYTLSSGTSFLTLQAGVDKKTGVKSIELHKNNQYTLLWDDNSTSLVTVSFRILFDQKGKRSITPELKVLAEFPAETGSSAPLAAVIRTTEDGQLTQTTLMNDNSFQVRRQIVTRDLFDNEKKESFSFVVRAEILGTITAFTVDEKGQTLYAGTSTGSLLRWDMSANEEAVRTDNVVATADKGAISSLALVFGDISIAVGDARGGLATWSQVWSGEGVDKVKKLRKVHSLTAHKDAVTSIVTSRRTKSIVSSGAGGLVHYDYMTSEKHLLDLDQPLIRFAIADGDKSLIGLDSKKNLFVWNIDNPHPEVSLKTLFGKVWYESYDKPEFVWQSSAGNDDFEPKFSIMPLLFGTIKGTLYAMIFAIPLSIFGAVYTSQLTTYSFKKSIKPMIEIMASVPSVVIGFLIALWLGPLIEKSILALLLCVLLLPLVLGLMMTIMMPYYRTPALKNRCAGYEFLLLVPVVLATIAFAVWFAPFVEKMLFSGNFLQWLYSDLGIR